MSAGFNRVRMGRGSSAVAYKLFHVHHVSDNFAIGIEGLGDETELGSSFLIMSIIGGAIIPPLTGLVSDRIGGIHHAMIIPALCFSVCLAFGLKGSRAAKEQRPMSRKICLALDLVAATMTARGRC